MRVHNLKNVFHQLFNNKTGELKSTYWKIQNNNERSCLVLTKKIQGTSQTIDIASIELAEDAFTSQAELKNNPPSIAQILNKLQKSSNNYSTKRFFTLLANSAFGRPKLSVELSKEDWLGTTTLKSRLDTQTLLLTESLIAYSKKQIVLTGVNTSKSINSWAFTEPDSKLRPFGDISLEALNFKPWQATEQDLEFIENYSIEIIQQMKDTLTESDFLAIDPEELAQKGPETILFELIQRLET